MIYNALIVGAGRIASGFDIPSADEIFTNAHAYTRHAGFNLLGFYDVNRETAKLASQKWNCCHFNDVSDVKEKVDVVSICTPDCCHLSSLRQILGLHPKLIFLEKPITNDLSEVENLTEIAKKIPIAVNYSRRYVIEFQKLSQRIFSGEFGEFIMGIGYYGKGFIHNGSHITDLLHLLIGEIKFVEKKSTVVDFYDNDPSINMTVHFRNNSEFFMRAISCNNFTIFEMDLVFQKARICPALL
jgi:predicted dehydrogenase